MPVEDAASPVPQLREVEAAGANDDLSVLDTAGAVDPRAPRAVLYDRVGDPSVLRIAVIEEAHPGPGEVRVAVKVAGLNPIDMKLRSGRYPVTDGEFPKGTGQDFAGVVDEVGEGARYEDGTPALVGHEVLGWTERQEAAREQLVVPARHLARKPEALPWDVAGALQTAALTAQACLGLLDIGSGDVVLVSAAAGGVGSVYAQLAIEYGAIAIGTASSANLPYLRSLGIIAVPYGPGLVDRVQAVLPGPLTAVQDNHGREAVDAGLSLGLPPDRIVTIADHAATAELGLASPGRYARSASTLSRIAELAAVGRLSLPVRLYPLSEAAAAYRHLEIGHGRGRIALSI